MQQNIELNATSKDRFPSDSSTPGLTTSTSGSTSAKDQSDKEKEDLIGEPAFTGFFRDGKRRVDIVLVIEDTKKVKVQKLRIDFVIRLIQMGMEIEVENGVAKEHKHMAFIKVHATDSIIEEFGHYFDMRKYFKDSHVEFMDRPRSFFKFLLPCPGINHEAETIKLVREQNPGPLNYSSLQRSCIVYKIMEMVPFGNPENYIGLNNLLKYKIILDAFPLHDGPYFFIPGQDISKPNGRQILFYHWVGMHNLFKFQPIHMIREYLGERIGFFFSFFDFYIKALFILAIMGLIVFIAGFYEKSDAVINASACTKYTHKLENAIVIRREVLYDTWWEKVPFLGYHFSNKSCSRLAKKCGPPAYRTHTLKWDFWKTFWDFYNFSYYGTNLAHVNKTTLVYTDLPVCPKCRDFFTCPARNLTQYCPEVKLKNLIDNPFAIIYSIFSCIWAIYFVLLWRRKDLYLSWMWEVSDDANMDVIRPEYRIRYSKTRNSKVIYYMKLVLVLFIRLIAPVALILAYFLGLMPLMIWVKYKMLKVTLGFEESWHFMTRTYFVLVLLAMFNGLIILCLDKGCKIISYFLVDLMSHRTEDTHEKYLVTKWFGFSFINNFTWICYFVFFKGLLYTFPGSMDNWYKPYGIGMENCGLLSCIDEIWIIYVFTTLSQRWFQSFYELFKKKVTDYNQPREVNETIPCWEKEFKLYPLTDDFVMQKYRDLIMQLAGMTLFISVCPLMSLYAMLVGVWDVRYYANLVTLRSRRPLIFKSWGLGPWVVILHILPYVAALCNAVSIAVNFNLIDKYAHVNKFNHTRFFQDYYMGYYSTEDFIDFGDVGKKDDPKSLVDDYYGHGFQPYFCLFPGKYKRDYDHGKKKPVPNSYQSWVGKWYVHWYQVLFVIAFEQIVVVMGAMLYYLIVKDPNDIEETRAVEETVRNYTMRHENLKKTE